MAMSSFFYPFNFFTPPLCKRGMTTDSPLWPLARRASDPEGKGELEGIFLKLWLNWDCSIFVSKYDIFRSNREIFSYLDKPFAKGITS